MKTDPKIKPAGELKMSRQQLIRSILAAALISALVSSTITALTGGIDAGFLTRWSQVYLFALPLAWVLRNLVWPKLIRLPARSD